MAKPNDTDKHPDDSVDGRDPAFEEFVAAALKVDPKGLSGKHRREDGPHDPHPVSDGKD